MKIKLEIGDRITLLNIFPEKDSFENLCLIRDITKKFNITAEEIETFEIKSIGDNKLTWKKEEEPKEFEITAKEVTFIADILKKLSDKSELTMQHLSLYEIFKQL